ncbi:MAG: RidA family protein [Zavarzinia sp.]|nr:RidA family protein [Zavarzinia sp.]
MKQHITVADAAPPPKTARYSHAVKAGGFLHVTGQLPIDPDKPDAPLPPSIEAQTELSMLNITRIVEGSGYSLKDTVFVRIFLADFDRDYVGMNSVFHRYYDDEATMPGRTTVGVARLGRGALVEIDMVLWRED